MARRGQTTAKMAQQKLSNSGTETEVHTNGESPTEAVHLEEINQETQLLPPTNGAPKQNVLLKATVRVSCEDNSAATAETRQPPKITPLDGGWGWLLVFSSSMLFMLVHGVVYSMGIFFNPLREYFGSSKAQASWLNSSVIGIYDFIGVIVSPCVTRFGFRRAAMFGSILAATSIFVSSFSTTMPALIVTFGFLGGIGLGFMHIPAVVIVGHYFEKRRSFATGLVCSMGGIGAFIFAPMLNYFIAEYGWRGTFWLLSGIMLNGLVCACLYRVVDLNTTQTLGVSEIIIEKPEKDRTLKEPLLQEKKGILPDDGLKRGDVISSGFGFGSKESLHNKVISSGDDKTPINDVLENISENSVRPNGDFDAMGDSDTVKQRQNDVNSLGSKNDIRADCQKSEVDESDSNSDDGLHTPDEVLQTVHSEAEDSKIYSGGGACQGFCRAVCKLLGLSLLKSPTFVTYTLSVFLWSAGLFVPPTYLPPLAYDLGIDSTRAAFLVSIIGFSNTLGRVVFGFVSDLPRVDPLVIKTVMVVVGGAATCTVPFLTTFPLLAAYCCVYGSSIGVYVTLRSPVLVDLVGLKNFTNAFGLLYMAHGIGGFVGSPLAIFLADATGNYKLSFFVIGAVFIVAGILCIPLRRIARWERRNLSTTK